MKLAIANSDKGNDHFFLQFDLYHQQHEIFFESSFFSFLNTGAVLVYQQQVLHQNRERRGFKFNRSIVRELGQVAGSVNQTVDSGPQMPGANLGMNDSVGTLFVGEK